MSVNVPVLSVRLSGDERALLAAAAKQSHTTISDFVRRKAIEAAEISVMENRIVEIAAADWAKFEAWAEAPARAIPELAQLAVSRPKWQD
ncbi:type II toxin-antitoxin system TacA family antitoxin [Pararhizobium sp.]|uniref:type II toxin-antitoxin system TacA family antitoxin n=1 Tax=Pararhizobium sp. TaxID=1977563 RepID=UPI00272376DC|nr:DUF1778 domain-containing protein [Pararhizobium sp.]MDO9415276.1 DUF1778 domain-containing protein [Pararhizobium sp.]